MDDLAELFSEDIKRKFSRAFKPHDFPIVTKQKANSEVEEDNDSSNGEADAKKRKKPKKKRVQIEATESAGIDEVGAAFSADNNATPTSAEVRDSNADKTLFVGNLSVKESVKSIKKIFSEFGEIVSVRLRSVPIEGAKVDDAGNQDLVRKVCVNSHKIGSQKCSFNAYIVFTNAESVKQAIEKANNRVINERHIRVDYCNPTHFDPKRTVFLGGLPIYIDEEELRDHLAKVSSYE